MDTKRRKRMAAIVACGIVCGSAGQATGQALEDFVLGLPTPLSYNYSIYTAAMKLGFFEQEGLRATLQGFEGGSILATQVSNKSVDIGSTSAEPVIISSETGGRKLPITFIYNQNRNYNWHFVVPQDSSINSLADLKGRKVKIGVQFLAGSNLPFTRVMLKEQGLVEGTDYELVSIGAGAPAFQALLNGRVDVYNTFTANIATFEALGTKLKDLPIPERFKNVFQTGFFTHSDYINSRPKLIVGFGRAYTKATLLCREATAWCVRNFWEMFPNLKPQNTTEEQALKQLVPALRVNWEHYFAFADGEPRRFGEYPKGSWETIVKLLHEGGVLKTVDVDVSKFYTNKFVETYNDFDHAALEQLIKTLR